MNRSIVFAGLGAMALFACGGDDDGGGDGGAGDSVEVAVGAAEGGEVAIGNATLTIPGGALAEDTTITATTVEPDGLPDADTLTGLAYDLGPAGLQFLTPVTLELPMVGSAGAGEAAVISWHDAANDAWVDVVSTVSGGKVSAEITHFTTFIVRFRDAGPVECSFDACGGDIVDTWNIDGLCATFPADEFDEVCPTATVEIVVDGSGTVAFNEDLTYAVNIDITGSLEIALPAGCVEGEATCEGVLGDNPDDPICSGTPASGCNCSKAIGDVNDDTGTYTLYGDDITFDGESVPSHYCVDGDTLKVQTVDDSGKTFTYTASR
jgi:hypothetical protein